VICRTSNSNKIPVFLNLEFLIFIKKIYLIINISPLVEIHPVMYYRSYLFQKLIVFYSIF